MRLPDYPECPAVHQLPLEELPDELNPPDLPPMLPDDEDEDLLDEPDETEPEELDVPDFVPVEPLLVELLLELFRELIVDLLLKAPVVFEVFGLTVEFAVGLF